MNLYGFAEFLGPVWTFYSFFTIQAVFRTEGLDAIFSLLLVSLTVLFVGRRRMNIISAFFVKKRISYTGIFKVWCLGNNLCEKYAFTFIQHSRSTFWLISTEAYNPEASKFPLLLRRFDGNDPSYKMGRVVLFWHKSPSRAFGAYARYKSMLRKIGQSSKPEHRAHGCLRHLYSVYNKRWRANGSVPSEID